jgi:hypothetical protein
LSVGLSPITHGRIRTLAALGRRRRSERRSFCQAVGAPVIFDHEGVSQVIATPTDTAAA